MEDRFRRKIDYARISMTEKCNLRCIYCMPHGYVPSNKKIISRNEIRHIVQALSSLGIKRIKLTGGEPLLREDIIEIVSDIKNIEGINDIGITTNGTLLDKYINELKRGGLNRINVSLDSLKKDVFKRITGGNIDNVIKSIKRAIELGFIVKINMLPIHGVNDNEIKDFIELTRDLDIDVRFIELMPMGPGKDYKGVRSDIIKKMLNHAVMMRVENNGGGPSEVYQIEGYKGRIGFISPMSHNFCHQCNRIRITSDGKLKTCLHNPQEIDLMPYIENIEKLKEVIYNGVQNKYEKHTMDIDRESKSLREMVRIGG
jgi:cyclic pyranopterin phosphate synthase